MVALKTVTSRNGKLEICRGTQIRLSLDNLALQDAFKISLSHPNDTKRKHRDPNTSPAVPKR